MHEWQITADQKADRIASNKTFKKVLKESRAKGLSEEAARTAAYATSLAELNKKSPGWEQGRGGFLSLNII